MRTYLPVIPEEIIQSVTQIEDIIRPDVTYNLRIPENAMHLLPIWDQQGYNTNKMKILLSTIAVHQRKDENGVFCAVLMISVLRELVPNAEKYIKFLISEGVIRRLGGYSSKEHYSYRYAFTENFKACKSIVLTDPKSIRKLNKARSENSRRNSNKYPKQTAIIKLICIDPVKAERLASDYYLNSGGYDGENPVDAYNSCMGVITKIMNREFYLKIDSSGNRLHTNLTNLPKFLRGEVRIDGKPIAGVDIRNSQPLFATKFLTDLDGAKQFFPGKYPSMMLKCLRLPAQSDVKRYQHLTSKAEFYKFLETEFNKRGCGYPVISERKVSDQLKAKVFQILFDKNHHTSLEKKIFHDLFPGVNKAFSVLRTGNYTDFVNSLARMEAHIVLDCVLDYLNTWHPETVATQIYDSITTSIATDNIDLTISVLSRTIFDFLGVYPTLKTEYYSEQEKAEEKEGEIEGKEVRRPL